MTDQQRARIAAAARDLADALNDAAGPFDVRVSSMEQQQIGAPAPHYIYTVEVDHSVVERIAG